MAEEAMLSGFNMSEVYQGLWNSLPSNISNNLDIALELGAILIIASIIYLVIMVIIKIIGLFFGSKEARRLKLISQQLDEIISLLKKRKPGKEEKKGKQ